MLVTGLYVGMLLSRIFHFTEGALPASNSCLVDQSEHRIHPGDTTHTHTHTHTPNTQTASKISHVYIFDLNMLYNTYLNDLQFKYYVSILGGVWQSEVMSILLIQGWDWARIGENVSI